MSNYLIGQRYCFLTATRIWYCCFVYSGSRFLCKLWFECRLSCLFNISFFSPFTMVYFSIYLCCCLSLTLGGNDYASTKPLLFLLYLHPMLLS